MIRFFFLLLVASNAYSVDSIDQSSQDTDFEQIDQSVADSSERSSEKGPKVTPRTLEKLKIFRKKHEVLIFRHPKFGKNFFLALIAEPYVSVKKTRSFRKRIFSEKGLLAIGGIGVGAVSLVTIGPIYNLLDQIRGPDDGTPNSGAAEVALTVVYGLPAAGVLAGAAGVGYLAGFENWDLGQRVDDPQSKVQAKNPGTDQWMDSMTSCQLMRENATFTGYLDIECARPDPVDGTIIQEVLLSQSELQRSAAVLVQKYGFVEVDFLSLQAE